MGYATDAQYISTQVQISDIDAGPLGRDGKPRTHATVTFNNRSMRITVRRPDLMATLNAIGDQGFAIITAVLEKTAPDSNGHTLTLLRAKTAEGAWRRTSIPAVRRGA